MLLRRVLIWVGLLALFVVGYQLRPTPLQIGLAMPVVFLVVFAVLLQGNLKTGRQYVAGQALLSEGRALEGLQVLEQARAQSRSAAPELGVAMAQLMLWRVDAATSSLERFQRRATAFGASRIPSAMRLAGPYGAFAHALLGRAEAAREWIAHEPNASLARLAEAVLFCRAGDFAQAAALLEANTVLLDQLGGTMRAFAETLTAYVASKTGGSGGTVDLVRLFREAGHDAFQDVWPELHAFIMRAARGPVG